MDIAKLLLEHGADVGVRDEKGSSPFLAAARRERVDLMEMVLEAGADLYEKKGGEDALVIACSVEGSDVWNFLVDRGVDFSEMNINSAFQRAVWRRQFEKAKHLLDLGADINLKDASGRSMIFPLSTSYQKQDVVWWLIEAGIDLDARTTNGLTALMFAAYIGKLEIVRVLLEAGADVRAADNFGKTVLMYAQEKKHEEVIQLLRKFGAEK
jgi:ankyrin repeat protein